MKVIGFIFSMCFVCSVYAQTLNKGRVRILYSPGKPSNTFIPSAIIGAAFDGHEKGDIKSMLSPENIAAMHSVGFKPIAYRLRTELSGEVWHWNPVGTWSESEKQQGYWISDSQMIKPIIISNGFYLPRRGNTIDQANNIGYSRLDDGDNATFWKSNPYLDEYFTKESNTLHPQWAIIDLGSLRDVNAVKINWGNPFAASYTLDYALDIGSDYFAPFQDHLWHHFPVSFIENARQENKIIRVSQKPIKVRFIRILMTQNKFAGPTNTDIRNRLGFAINEIQAGVVGPVGKFIDWVRHAADHKKQSTAYVSSTDPWHRAIDIDVNVEQAGIDYFFTSGLTNHQPVIMPAGLLYDTPENVKALIKYLSKKKYPVTEIEMGEEPEGQLISPVDYGALYYQWGKMIKEIAPSMRLGGPGFATLAFLEDEENYFTEAKWTTLFLEYLKKQNGLYLFNFFSFEWYPFDDLCEPSAPQLAVASKMLDIAMKNINKNILPAGTALYLTEYGYSAFSGRAEVDIEGALMYADILGKFLTLGGSKNFLYGYEPAYLETDNCDFGNNILFGLDGNGKIQYRTAAFYGMQMLTHYWLQPADSLIEIFPATCNIINDDKLPLVTSYNILKPDGSWSIALINKDPKRAFNIDIDVENTLTGKIESFHPVQSIQYSGQQYHWQSNHKMGHPSLNLPPVKKSFKKTSAILLPPYSLTILQ